MKPKTAIHLLADQTVKTHAGFETVMGAMRHAPGGVARIPIVKDHGAVRQAWIPLSSVVWFEDLQ
jgi:hypothetical protein